MLNDMLKEYKKDDYVYVIEGCLDLYVSEEPCKDEKCPVCGDYDWPYCEGFVFDIRKAKDLKDLEKIKLRKQKRDNNQKEEQGPVKKLVTNKK